MGARKRRCKACDVLFDVNPRTRQNHDSVRRSYERGMTIGRREGCSADRYYLNRFGTLGTEKKKRQTKVIKTINENDKMTTEYHAD